MKASDLRFVFFGTSYFSILVLEELLAQGYAPALIITMPDRASSRKLTITPPDIKAWANDKGIDLIQPETFDRELESELLNTSWDLFIVASYGKILPSTLLNIPKHGTLNVHPSLLPKYRGASPIQAQILHDDRKVGITVMLMDTKMDHGAILAQARMEIEEKDWPLSAGVLEEMLAKEGGKLLGETMGPWIKGKITPEDQREEDATYVKKIKKEDGEIQFADDSRKNYLKFCAFEKWPGTYFFAKRGLKRVRVKIANATFEKGEFIVTRVIPEGKREMSYQDFLRG